MKYHNVRIHNALYMFLLIDSYHIQRAYVRQNDRLKWEKGMESHIKRQNCPKYVPDCFFRVLVNVAVTRFPGLFSSSF